ncbi:MAG: endopeptidase La [Burkholderiales bacterium]|jgi:ATP-dependent Lon protease
MSSQPSTPLSLPQDVIALVPMRNVLLFPHVLLPITVGRSKSLEAIRYAMGTKAKLLIVLQKNSAEDDPDQEGLTSIGTLATVVRELASADGQIHVVCQGIQRVRILELVPEYPFLAARIELIAEGAHLTKEVQAMGIQLRERVAELMDLLPGIPAELAHALQATRSASHLADMTASLIDVELAEKQKILETLNLEDRLQKVLELVAHRIEVLRLSQEIGERTKEQLQDRERKYLLREQLKTIQRELGEEGDEPETEKLEQAIVKASMPPDTEAHVRKELQRLRRMAGGGAETGHLQTWIEWMTELPWSLPDSSPIDLDAAQKVLESDHFGLDRVKRRILEFLAVKKLNPQGRAPILCFVGPPGVGKTSLGQSIAKALQRPFVRVSLGGVHDEAEMRGHRRTYMGALPGNIIQSLRKAGARDCVMMLDEVDKMTASYQGDPSAALLEILDPEQNSSFRDNYLGVSFDLSRVVFIATANLMDTVSAPVQDRMEVIELPGYTQEEKLEIAKRYLIQRQLDANGLRADQCELGGEVIKALIEGYTRESGVRQLEREIARILRHAATQVARDDSARVKVDAQSLPDILGPAKFEHELALRASLPGVATGLAWTSAGGDILFIEAIKVMGKGKLILTGQLGDVMKESAQAALTLVKSLFQDLKIPADAFDAVDVHLHVPAGAVPKDGPSAGVAMFSALASLFSHKTVRHDVAMTGEISLRGLVLPVGGIKEKVLAAQRAGLAVVLLPSRNRKDLHEVPQETQSALRFVLIETVHDALKIIFEPVGAGVSTSAELEWV